MTPNHLFPGTIIEFQTTTKNCIKLPQLLRISFSRGNTTKSLRLISAASVLPYSFINSFFHSVIPSFLAFFSTNVNRSFAPPQLGGAGSKGKKKKKISADQITQVGRWVCVWTKQKEIVKREINLPTSCGRQNMV